MNAEESLGRPQIWSPLSAEPEVANAA
ncbi:UNVERIFIED_ORG: hypothetical protein ABID57_003340 [Arthrobacter sp. UYEF1]